MKINECSIVFDFFWGILGIFVSLYSYTSESPCIKTQYPYRSNDCIIFSDVLFRLSVMTIIMTSWSFNGNFKKKKQNFISGFIALMFIIYAIFEGWMFYLTRAKLPFVLTGMLYVYYTRFYSSLLSVFLFPNNDESSNKRLLDDTNNTLQELKNVMISINSNIVKHNQWIEFIYTDYEDNEILVEQNNDEQNNDEQNNDEQNNDEQNNDEQYNDEQNNDEQNNDEQNNDEQNNDEQNNDEQNNDEQNNDEQYSG